jgi:hypothetical protein
MVRLVQIIAGGREWRFAIMTLIEAIDQQIELTTIQIPLMQLYRSSYLVPGEYADTLERFDMSFNHEFTFLWMILVAEGVEE